MAVPVGESSMIYLYTLQSSCEACGDREVRWRLTESYSETPTRAGVTEAVRRLANALTPLVVTLHNAHALNGWQVYDGMIGRLNRNRVSGCARSWATVPAMAASVWSTQYIRVFSR